MTGRFLLMELDNVSPLGNDGVLDELAFFDLNWAARAKWLNRLPGNPGVKRPEGKREGLSFLLQRELLLDTIAKLACKGFLALVIDKIKDTKRSCPDSGLRGSG